MDEYAKRRALKILGLLLDGGRLSGELLLRVQQWFVCDTFRREKDAAFEELFNERVNYDPDPSGYAYELFHQFRELRDGQPENAHVKSCTDTNDPGRIAPACQEMAGKTTKG